MRDEAVIEPFSVQEIFVDGFCNHVNSRGVMSCVGYRLQPSASAEGGSVKVVVIRLVWPSVATEEAIAEAREAQAAPLDAQPKPGIKQRH